MRQILCSFATGFSSMAKNRRRYRAARPRTQSASCRDAAAVTNTSNPYCAALAIPVPRIEDARCSPNATYYSLLLVALLENSEIDSHAIPVVRGCVV